MFIAKIKDSKAIKGIFDAVSSIISQTRLKIDPAKGLTMTSMDGSHICCVSLTINKDDMEFSSDKTYELGINLEDLVKIIKRSNAKEEITFIHDPKEKKLTIELKPENGKKSRIFALSLIDIEEDEINLNTLHDVKYQNQCEFDLHILDEAIKDAEIFSEVLLFTIKNKQLTFSTEGSIGEMHYKTDTEELKTLNFSEETEGSFALQFLRSILKIDAVSKEVKMELKTEAPLHLKFNLLENSEIEYYLAPRVEEDTETTYEQ